MWQLFRAGHRRPGARPEPEGGSAAADGLPGVRVGDQMPHFTVTTLDGARIRYADVWQRQNLLLVLLDDDRSAAATTYVQALRTAVGGLEMADTVTIVTRDAVAGLACPGVFIADRWGQIYFAARAAHDADLPAVSELIDWLGYVQMQCPECEGEVR